MQAEPTQGTRIRDFFRRDGAYKSESIFVRRVLDEMEGPDQKERKAGKKKRGGRKKERKRGAKGRKDNTKEKKQRKDQQKKSKAASPLVIA